MYFQVYFKTKLPLRPENVAHLRWPGRIHSSGLGHAEEWGPRGQGSEGSFRRVLWARLVYEVWGGRLTLEGTPVLPERPLLRVPAGRLLQKQQGSETRRLSGGDPGTSRAAAPDSSPLGCQALSAQKRQPLHAVLSLGV